MSFIKIKILFFFSFESNFFSPLKLTDSASSSPFFVQIPLRHHKHTVSVCDGTLMSCIDCGLALRAKSRGVRGGLADHLKPWQFLCHRHTKIKQSPTSGELVELSPGSRPPTLYADPFFHPHTHTHNCVSMLFRSQLIILESSL